MHRNRWLIPTTILLVLVGVAHHIWANWGLVTVHSTTEPLSKVIRQIEKQGRVTIKTDLDLNTPVHMNVDKVVVTEALETLAAVTDGRWRLAFFVAGDKATVSAGLAGITAGQKPEGWKIAFVPAPPIGDQPDLPPDPRAAVWTVSAPAEPKVQAYLDAAARQVSAQFLFPESWNPEVKSTPKSGPISKVLPKLVSAVDGQSAAVFLLQKGGGRFAGGPGGEDGGGRPDARADAPRPTDGTARPDGPGGRNGGFNREAMEERMKAEIAKLPADQRPKAEAEMEERRAFFDSLKDLTPEQRRAKFEEMMSDPSRQEKMEARMAAEDARRSPQQRLERSKKYVERKAQTKSGASTGGSGAAPTGSPRP